MLTKYEHYSLLQPYSLTLYNHRDCYANSNVCNTMVYTKAMALEEIGGRL
jgi:hypothetical protein